MTSFLNSGSLNESAGGGFGLLTGLFFLKTRDLAGMAGRGLWGFAGALIRLELGVHPVHHDVSVSDSVACLFRLVESALGQLTRLP